MRKVGMQNVATKQSWKTLDPPKSRVSLGYKYVFNEAEVQLLHQGLIPKVMEDKWFVYFENGWLYLHRSWTGSLVFWLKLDDCPTGACVGESWVSRQPEQYRGTDILYDQLLLDFLLRRSMLGQKVSFPIPQKAAAAGPPGLYQHHLVGRGFTEKIVPDTLSNNYPTTIYYAERKPRLALWVDLFLGGVAVTVIFPIVGFIVFQSIRRTGAHLFARVFFVAVALTGLGFGVWCMNAAIRSWKRRNIVEQPISARVQLFRWQWIIPGTCLVICVLQLRDSDLFTRAHSIAFGVLFAASFIKLFVGHIRAARFNRRVKKGKS